MAVRNSSRAPRRDPLWVLAAVLLGLVTIIVAARILAPERADAPARSVIEYAPRPDSGATPAAFAGQGSSPSAGDESRASRPAAVDETTFSARLHGVVRSSEDGTPVSNAAVKVWYAPDALQHLLKDSQTAVAEGRIDDAEALDRRVARLTGERVARTDRAGHYAVRLPEPGPYYAELTAWGFIPQQSDSFEVAEGEEATRRDFTLSRGARITGRVMERGTNAPASRVMVDLRAVQVEGKFVPQSSPTNDEGVFLFEGLVPGAYVVSLNLRDAPYIVAGDAPARDVQVPNADATVQGIDFVVEPAGIVWGYVQRATDQAPVRGTVMLSSLESPINQALQSVSKAAPPLTAATKDDGYYELIGVPLKREWCVYFVRGDASPQLSDPFVLTPTHRAVRVDLNVFEGTRVFGHVVNQDGAPVPDAQVACLPAYGAFLRPMRAPLALADDQTNDAGAFEFPYIPPGEYQIIAQREGYKFELSGKKIYSTGQGQVGPVKIVLSSIESGRYSVYGHVTDLDGAPIEGARLRLAGMSGGTLSAEQRETASDRRGYYVFYGVDTGYYLLTADKQGYRDVLVREVRLDVPTDIIMRQTVAIEGTLLARDTREAPEGGRVWAAAVDGDVDSLPAFFEGLAGDGVDRDGRFRIEVVPGRHLLRATAPNYVNYEAEMEVGAGGADAGTIYLNPASGRISGVVRVVDGSSPAGATVQLHDAAAASIASLADRGRGPQVSVGVDGGFVFTGVSPGRYRVLARLGGFTQAHSEAVYVGDGQDVSGLVIVIGMGGTFEGYVMQNGSVIPEAVVTVNGNGFTSMTSTDYNGYYRIENIPAGMYMAMAARVDGVNLAAFAPMHTTIEIAEGQTTVHNFGQEQGVPVNGRVNPPPQGGEMGFAVVTVPGAGDMIGGRLNSPASWFTSADGFGAYMIDVKPIDGNGQFTLNAPPGDYDLHIVYGSVTRIIAQDMRPLHTQPLHVSAGGPADVNIRIDGP